MLNANEVTLYPLLMAWLFFLFPFYFRLPCDVVLSCINDNSRPIFSSIFRTLDGEQYSSLADLLPTLLLFLIIWSNCYVEQNYCKGQIDWFLSLLQILSIIKVYLHFIAKFNIICVFQWNLFIWICCDLSQ